VEVGIEGEKRAGGRKEIGGVKLQRDAGRHEVLTRKYPEPYL
jgi:hypothetical protein